MVFYKCPHCCYVQETEVFEKNLRVCIKCGYNETIDCSIRLRQIIDQGTFKPMDESLGFENPIQFPEYELKYQKAFEKTGLPEAVITGEGIIEGMGAMIGIMDSRFMMSSMGIVVGEKITRLFEMAMERQLPVIIFSASGGARMQEGVMALMQMAKTAGAVARFSESGGLYISVLTNPTTGGVSASFSFLGDIILAEPGAMIGFAGKRVIEQTIHETLPEGFQKAEYLLEHGFLDAVVERKNLKTTLHQLLKFHSVRTAAAG